MTPIILAGPAVEPVGLADMRAFLRLDTEAEDDLVAALVSAARQTLERATRVAFVGQSWRLRGSAWPPGRMVSVPLAPVLGLEALQVDGVPVPVDGVLRLDGPEAARIVVEAAAPDPIWARDGIAIDIRLGFGEAPASVPAPLRLAVQRLVAHWYENRGDRDAAGPGDLPGDVALLVAPFRRPRLA